MTKINIKDETIVSNEEYFISKKGRPLKKELNPKLKIKLEYLME